MTISLYKNILYRIVYVKYVKLFIMMVAAYCYFERENYKVSKFLMYKSFYFKISVSL